MKSEFSRENQLEFAFSALLTTLDSLKEAITIRLDENGLTVDACLHRYKLTIELFLKLLQKIIEIKGKKAFLPADIFTESYQANLIASHDFWMKMIKDRNLISKAYNKELAMRLYNNIKEYYPVLRTTCGKLSKEF
jgi:nucleotidyltransferase substrate binding protein (TIGR01987 family)